MVQPAFIIIDKDRRGDMHCIYKHEAFHNPAFSQAVFNLPGYINIITPVRSLNP
jgi:hypothetical protein